MPTASRRRTRGKPATPAAVWRGRLLSALLSTVLALGLAELGFRVFWLKRLVLGAGIEHPHFHHRLLPNTSYDFISNEFHVTTRTNSYGLRGPDPVIPKPPGVVRILMLGDSFTFGFPVKDDETFCSLIERRLRAQGYPVEVINGGVSGASPTLHYIALRDQFLAFEPDLVILWFDRGDVQEDAWFQKNLVYDSAGRIVRCDPLYINGRFNRWEYLKRYSALAKYLDQKVWRVVQRVQILGLKGYLRVILRGERAKVAIARLKAKEHGTDLAEYDKFILIREAVTPETIRPYLELSEKYILMIRDLLASRQIPLLLVAYPYGVSVAADEWEKGRVYWGFEKGRVYDPTVLKALLDEFSARTNIPRIKTVKAMREAAAKETNKLYYDWDGHLTPTGHRVLADIVAADPQVLDCVQQQVPQAARPIASANDR